MHGTLQSTSNRLLARLGPPPTSIVLDAAGGRIMGGGGGDRSDSAAGKGRRGRQYREGHLLANLGWDDFDL